MKYVYEALNWTFGILLLLVGLIILFQSVIAGICLILASVLLLPITRNFFYKKTKINISFKARFSSIVVLFIAFGFFNYNSESLKQERLIEQQSQARIEKAKQKRQEKINYFNSNREEILFSLKKELSKRDYQSVLEGSNIYLVSQDEEIKKINAQARKAIDEENKNIETRKLLNDIELTSSTDFKRKRDLYAQLIKLYPDNKNYRRELDFNSRELEKIERKELIAKKRKKDIESQFSLWDGSHLNLEKVVKRAMNDPDSYEHVKTTYWDNDSHLIVLTEFRGKNAFGGVVKNFVKAKISLNGEIIRIMERS